MITLDRVDGKLPVHLNPAYISEVADATSTTDLLLCSVTMSNGNRYLVAAEAAYVLALLDERAKSPCRDARCHHFADEHSYGTGPCSHEGCSCVHFRKE